MIMIWRDVAEYAQTCSVSSVSDWGTSKVDIKIPCLLNEICNKIQTIFFIGQINEIKKLAIGGNFPRFSNVISSFTN